MRHELYRVADLPVLQNRTFADPAVGQGFGLLPTWCWCRMKRAG